MKRIIALFACMLALNGFTGVSRQPGDIIARPFSPIAHQPPASDLTHVWIGLPNEAITESYYALRLAHPLLDDSSLLPTRELKTPEDVGRAGELLRNTGIRFTENRGQMADTRGTLRPDVKCSAEAGGVKIFFRSNGVSYVFKKSASARNDDPRTTAVTPALSKQRNSEEWPLYRMDMDLLFANPEPRIRFEEELPGYCNYYLPHCPQGITFVKSYGRIVYENVYPDIDLVFKSVDGRMKYEYVVRPGGNASDIRMKYSGAIDMDITKNGAFEVRSPFGYIVEDKPYTFQNESDEVRSYYRIKANALSFDLESYDRSRTLIIDPWATYYGGSDADFGFGIATDGNGNVVITGRTASTTLPVQNSSAYAGGTDVFVAKFNGNGAIQWSTFYGGSAYDTGYGIVTDGSGNIVVTGRT